MERIGEDSQAPEHQHIFDLEQQIREEIKKLPTITTKPCIFQIPQHIRSISPKSYTPVRVAIGPYHSGEEDFKSMESHKLRYLDSLLSRSGDQNKLKDSIAEIEKRASAARQCYSGIEELRNKPSSQEFKKMLLLDGAFILQFFIKMAVKQNVIDKSNESATESISSYADITDPIFDNESVPVEVCRDLIQLENQLPFFILQALFDCLFSSRKPSFTLPWLAYACLYDLIPTRSKKELNPREVHERMNEKPVMHLIHLVRMCCLNAPKGPSRPKHGALKSLYLKLKKCWRRKTKEIEHDQIRQNISATELCEAGVHFKMVEKGQFIDINFDEDKGVLEMPSLILDDGTESFFRNIMAFEQYHLNEHDFTNYMFFMDGLIDIAKDVHLLERSRLIDNWLESKEDATTLFNSITKQAVSCWEYHPLAKKLTTYVMKPSNKWKAMLRRDYFGSPWAIISFIAAVVLLGLTFVQTIASVRSIN